MYSHFETIDWATPYGLGFLLAISTAWWFARRNASSVNIDGSHVDLLIPIAIMVGIAGGVLLSLAMPMDRMVAGESLRTGVRVRLFGMLGLAAVAVFVYSQIQKMSFPRLIDVFALPTLAGVMVHRVGCFLAGCCWGDVVSGEANPRFAPQIQTLPFLNGLSKGVQYPPGSLPYEQHMSMQLIEAGAPASLAVYPVQLYEGALLVAVLLALSRLPWRRLRWGTLTLLVGGSYAFVRFFLEFLRADGHIMLGYLTVTQLQCLVIILGAAILLRLSPESPQQAEIQTRQ